MKQPHLRQFQFRPIPKEPPLPLMGVAILGLLALLDLALAHAALLERL